MQKCKDLDKLHGSYSALLNAVKNHNIEHAENAIQGIGNIQEGFWDNVDEFLVLATSETNALKELYISNLEYTKKLYDLLNTRGIYADMKDNTLLIGPMDIVIDVEEYHIMLNVGRKKQRITDLELGKVAKMIELNYKKLNSSFNASNFFKRLQRAYEYANARMYGTREPKYGYAVSLKDLFDIFTIAPASADYKIENFLWDLGRLISGSAVLEPYRLEYGFSRDVKKMFLIKGANGENLKVSTLTIHKDKE